MVFLVRSLGAFCWLAWRRRRRLILAIGLVPLLPFPPSTSIKEARCIHYYITAAECKDRRPMLRVQMGDCRGVPNRQLIQGPSFRLCLSIPIFLGLGRRHPRLITFSADCAYSIPRFAIGSQFVVQSSHAAAEHIVFIRFPGSV